MIHNILTIFIAFIIYAFIGWIFEVICVAFIEKKFVNRGFLIGPYCPIYGFGSITMTLLLQKYKDDIMILFVMSVVICSILEYITSYIMEKLFKARWWDYSHKKFNINGRISLYNSIIFGIFGCLIILAINPMIIKIINLIPNIMLYIISFVLFCIFIIDNIISFKIINGMKNTAYQIKKDNTSQITEKVKEILKNKSILSKRLINAFPNFSSTLKTKADEIEEKRKQIIEKINIAYKKK
ncbi:MAG: putative ABC transporter permease [Clostridia bacterium]